MKRFGWVVALSFLAACGATTDPDGGAGGTGGGGGSGGTGGEAPPNAEYDLDWQDGDPFPISLDHHVTFVHETAAGAFLHVTGGFRGTAFSASSWSARIADDGSLGEWTSTLPLPSPQAGHALAHSGDRVLAIGGMDSGVAPLAKVRVGHLGDDGGIESWTEGAPLPSGRFHAAAVARGRDVWVLGGIEGTVANQGIFHAVLGDDGAPGAWTETAPLPAPRSHEAALVRNGFVYVLGGLSGNPNDATAVSHADVWRARLGDDGVLGEWEALEELPVSLASHSAVAVGRSLFVLGGVVDDQPSAAVYRSRFEEDGTLGPWEEIDALPAARAHVHQSPVYRGHVYRIGGSVGGMKPRPEVAIGTLARIDEAATRSSP